MKKFEKISLFQGKIDSELNKNQNKINSILSEDYNSKKSNIIAETDWITTTLSTSISQVITPGLYLPGSANLNTYLDFTLDSKFIPFIKVEFLNKIKDNIEFVGLMEYPFDYYGGDYIEVYGNGSTLIYKGTPHVSPYIYPQADLDAGKFSVDYTKQVYYGSIDYTIGADEYRVGGILSTVTVTENIDLSPYGNQNKDMWVVDYNPYFSSAKNYAKFTSLTSLGFTGHSYKTEVRWLPFDPVPPGPPFEYQQNTFFDDVLVTKSFTSDMTLYRISEGAQYKKVSGEWVYQSGGTFIINDNTVTSKTFTFQGYFLFWDTSTSYQLGVRDVFPIVHEGSSRKIELYNLPKNPFRNWTTIILKRYPDPYPLLTQATVFVNGENQHALIKIFKTSDRDKDKYRLRVEGLLIYKALANKKQDINPAMYNDTYTKSGTLPSSTYSASEIHTLKTLSYYRLDTGLEVEYKIRISLINPYEFSTRNNYAT